MNSFLGTDFRTGIIIWVNVSLIINIGLFVSGMLLVDKDILSTTMPTDMLESCIGLVRIISGGG